MTLKKFYSNLNYVQELQLLILYKKNWIKSKWFDSIRFIFIKYNIYKGLTLNTIHKGLVLCTVFWTKFQIAVNAYMKYIVKNSAWYKKIIITHFPFFREKKKSPNTFLEIN